MNLQYGAVMLAPDDVILASSDGLGDVLDPIAAKVPPKEFGLRFAVRYTTTITTTTQWARSIRVASAIAIQAAHVVGCATTSSPQDWHQFAKQHALDGPTTVQELKVQRLQEALGNIPDPVQSSDIKVWACFLSPLHLPLYRVI